MWNSNKVVKNIIGKKIKRDRQSKNHWNHITGEYTLDVENGLENRGQ